MSLSAEMLETTPIMPPIPAELWGLWTVPDEGGAGFWCLSLDDAPRGETILVALSREEAIVAARYQEESYEIRCIPVRIK